ncbi:MAG TPA: DUF6807 family protein, partial [Candidatus Glassbacteria bacterium]|nr:DUF6807 family protein [Candidatus Glassbacteria bacterium]
MKKPLSSYLFLLAAAFLAGCAGSGNSLDLSVPEELAGSEFPFSLRLPAGLNPEITVLRVEIRGGNGTQTVYAQSWRDSTIEAGDAGPTAVATFLWKPSLGGPGSYRLSFSQLKEESASAFTLSERGGKFLDLVENGRPVLSYVYGMHLAEGAPEDRRRSSYIHPVYGPDGVLLSDDFPADHFHHRGIFWAWPQVLVEGQSYSLWDIRGIYQRFEKWLSRETGPVFAEVGVQNGWYAGERRVVDEKVFFRVFTAGSDQRLIDFTLRWEATETPVTLLGSPDSKGYGGFSFRYAPFTDPTLTTAGGRQSE